MQFKDRQNMKAILEEEYKKEEECAREAKRQMYEAISTLARNRYRENFKISVRRCDAIQTALEALNIVKIEP